MVHKSAENPEGRRSLVSVYWAAMVPSGAVLTRLTNDIRLTTYL